MFGIQSFVEELNKICINQRHIFENNYCKSTLNKGWFMENRYLPFLHFRWSTFWNGLGEEMYPQIFIIYTMISYKIHVRVKTGLLCPKNIYNMINSIWDVKNATFSTTYVIELRTVGLGKFKTVLRIVYRLIWNRAWHFETKMSSHLGCWACC